MHCEVVNNGGHLYDYIQHVPLEQLFINIIDYEFGYRINNIRVPA